MEIEELKKKLQWINWAENKVPHNSRTGYQTGTTINHSHEWVDYETAKNAIKKFNFAGVGIILCDGLCGIDIDHKNIEDSVVQDIINLMDTYTEFSPSGKGFHLLFTVDINKIPKYMDTDGKEKLSKKYFSKNSKLNIECYISGLTSRYFTFTGNSINNKSISERTEQLIQFLNKYMIKQENNNIDKLIENIKKSKHSEKFNKLFYDGDISDYNYDDSRADLALCSILALYTKDFNTIDEILKQSKLYREKWDRKDYKERTINNAIKDKNITLMDNITNNNTINELEYITARDLQNKELAPITYYVQDILPQGLTLICSAPKIGKSWLALNMCLSICRGLSFLKFNTKEAGCLYLALEDSHNRLKERMNKLLNNENAPENLIYSINCNDLQGNLIEQLENILKKEPTIKVIVIDTLQKIRSESKSNSVYAHDYKDLSMIKGFADKYDLCVVVIHHTKKGNELTDIFEKVSGTNGITGTADTTWIIHKPKRTDNKTILSVVGRDVELNEYIINFDKDLCKWKMISTVEENEKQKEKDSYYSNTLVKVIKKLIDENNGSWTGSIKSMNSKHEEMWDKEYEKSSQKFRKKLDNLSSVLWEYDKIKYIPPNNPINGERLHTFMKK